MFGMEDITFCVADCKMKAQCYRNPELIKEPQYPHSYADFSKNCMAYEPRENDDEDNDNYTVATVGDADDSVLCAARDSKQRR